MDRLPAGRFLSRPSEVPCSALNSVASLGGRHNLLCDLPLTVPLDALTVILHRSGDRCLAIDWEHSISDCVLCETRRDNGGRNGAQIVPSHTIHFGYAPRPRDPGGR
jgi:hypothetical protein